MIAYIVYMVQLIGAANRAGEAVRNRRAPSAGDIAILGLPASFYAR